MTSFVADLFKTRDFCAFFCLNTGSICPCALSVRCNGHSCEIK